MNFDQVSPRSMNFLHAVASEPDNFKALALTLIQEMDAKHLLVPDFNQSFDWINTSDRLSLRENLSGKICVLDFFTYCCINCMHVLPDLHALEQKFSVKEGVVVVGVHSAKFENEKILTNILNAVIRYDIDHAVVNDADAVMWNAMSIRCWPTFVVVSPEGNALLYLVGEGHRDVLLKFVDVALQFYNSKGLIRSHELPMRLAKDLQVKSQLSFPGKLAVSETDGRLAISDTGNNQVVVVDADGVLISRIGSGKCGCLDGSLETAQFRAPQGLTWHKDLIYVADTDNHVIRCIDLVLQKVSTIIGVGSQGSDKEGGGKGTEQPISSPWDVLLGPSPGSDGVSDDTSCLYIAMAGTHQIWCYYLRNGSWLKKGNQVEGTCLRFAGSGNEENRNNSYPHKAAFAQPSGITLATLKEKPTLFVADSESSSVRSVDVLTGAVRACVGGERDPMNLFAYGDVDGKGVEAKLQHPLAVAYNKADGFVYVADSYNHKIKVIDPLKMTCSTLAGIGTPGKTDGSLAGSSFDEPGDVKLSADGMLMYVADTNNHAIRTINLQDQTLSTFVILDAEIVNNMNIGEQVKAASNDRKPLVGSNAQVFNLEPTSRCLTTPIPLTLDVKLQQGLNFTEDVESKFQLIVSPSDSGISTLNHLGVLQRDGTSDATHMLPVCSCDLDIEVQLRLFVCTGDSTCLMQSFVIKQHVQHGESASSSEVIISLPVNDELLS